MLKRLTSLSLLAIIIGLPAVISPVEAKTGNLTTRAETVVSTASDPAGPAAGLKWLTAEPPVNAFTTAAGMSMSEDNF